MGERVVSAVTNDIIAQKVAGFVAEQTGARDVSVREFQRLSGGTIQDNFALELIIEGGSHAGNQSLVLRTDAPSSVSVSHNRAEEFAILKSAFDAGVRAPEPLWLCTDELLIGKPFYFMRRAGGTAAAHKLVRGDLNEAQRASLVETLGSELAKLHNVKPPCDNLAFLPTPNTTPAQRRIDEYRTYLDELPNPQPVLEWALRWLELHAPKSHDLSLCHGDFRTGNYMVDGAELTGILDWEFASWSDPHEDIGWLCARCWRFGNWDRHVGGIGDREALYRGYESVAGKVLDIYVVPYWEVMATLRWAVIALQQAQRHLSGEQRSLELALTGRMVPKMELDLLTQIDQIERTNHA